MICEFCKGTGKLGLQQEGCHYCDGTGFKEDNQEDDDINMCSECEFELGLYEYKGKLYCSECLLNQLEKEEKIETWTVQHYMVDSEYYGNDNENDMEEVTDNIAKVFKIKKIEK